MPFSSYKETSSANTSTLGKPQVSVVCVTYNHEQFISQALESFLAQTTSFPIEIIVADDYSTDATWDILNEYARGNSCIKIYRPEQHQGAERNLVAACGIAKASYIAMCDGDDYWSDPSKLQKQFDLMEAHPEYKACFHDTEIIVEGEHPWLFEPDYNKTPDGKLRWCTGNKYFEVQQQYTLDEYIPRGFVHSSSMFYRWDYALEIPGWYYDHILGDYTMWCLQVGAGKFGYINETMSVYRRWGGSVYEFSSRFDFWQQTRGDWVAITADLLSYFSGQDGADDIRRALQKHQWSDLRKLLLASFGLGGWKEFRNKLQEYAPLFEKYSHKNILENNNHEISVTAALGAFLVVLRYWLGYCKRERRLLVG